MQTLSAFLSVACSFSNITLRERWLLFLHKDAQIDIIQARLDAKNKRSNLSLFAQIHLFESLWQCNDYLHLHMLWLGSGNRSSEITRGAHYGSQSII
jgi:hypothetical protein